MRTLDKRDSPAGLAAPAGPRRSVASGVCLAVWLALPAVAGAQLLELIEYSTDVTAAVGLAPTILDDEDVAADDLQGVVVVVPLGSIPASTDVVAYHITPEEDALLAFDTSVSLDGAVATAPGDVVRYDGLSFTVEFDASGSGLPPGATTDAVASLGEDLLLSFDTTVELPGAVVADDEDLVLFDGASFSVHFDGSAAGVPRSLDLDAAHVVPSSGDLLLSFDGSGTVGGVVFDDEDVLRYAASGGTWSLAYNGSAYHAAWSAADLDALVGVAGSATTTTTTTTTLGSTTTTTLGPPEGCGTPRNGGPAPLASDCLFILQAAVGSRDCEVECLCDLDGDGRLVATDALFCLQAAVGDLSKLNCMCPAL